MWLVWFLFFTHSATIFAVQCDSCGVTNFPQLIFNWKCNNCRGLQYSTICKSSGIPHAITSYALTSILSMFCLWFMLQLFSCSQVWQPLLSSFPVSSSSWSPCFTISCRHRLFPLLLAFGWSVTKHNRARRNRVVVSFSALEEIMSYVSFSMHLPVSMPWKNKTIHRS